MNTPRARLFASRERRRRAALVGAVPIRTGSFVSMLVDAQAVRTYGLPKAEYFIWNDDFEYSARLLRHGDGLLVEASVCEHRTKAYAGALDQAGDRFFYEIRNKLWTFAWGRVFGPLDWLAYLVYTKWGWVGAIRRAPDKLVALRAVGRGVKAGLVRPPRPNRLVLGGLGSVSREVAGVEPAANRAGR
jgi:GT2 family glycosyltransferase